jgi:hypothetical protein
MTEHFYDSRLEHSSSHFPILMRMVCAKLCRTHVQIAPDTLSTNPGQNDIITTWGEYTTPEAVQASPYYTPIPIPVNPRHAQQWRNNASINSPHFLPPSSATFMLHAVHPITRRFLDQMSEDHLRYAAHYLFEEHQETFIDSDPEWWFRVSHTIERINDVLVERSGVALSQSLRNDINVIYWRSVDLIAERLERPQEDEGSESFSGYVSQESEEFEDVSEDLSQEDEQFELLGEEVEPTTPGCNGI